MGTEGLMRRRFVTLDVVTHRRVAGNPLAPVLDAEDLDDGVTPLRPRNGD
jgi:predicted PhzF superfamily epimerase YddE/YHI9